MINLLYGKNKRAINNVKQKYFKFKYEISSHIILLFYTVVYDDRADNL